MLVKARTPFQKGHVYQFLGAEFGTSINFKFELVWRKLNTSSSSHDVVSRKYQITSQQDLLPKNLSSMKTHMQLFSSDTTHNDPKIT